MNPHSAKPTSLFSLFKSLWIHRQLIRQMVWREVIGRYRGSIMGLLWSFINPVLMLAVYTFVFSVVFQAKWGVETENSKTAFALVLFVGMIVHGLLAEVINRSPSLILTNVNYVKKVIFPLEILPVVSLCSALFHTAISLIVLLIALVLWSGQLSWTIILIPVILLPLAVLVLGFAWIFASLGVYIRDIGQAIGILTTILLFLAPVFFPLSALPKAYHPVILANPLTFIIEQAREVLIFGHMPNWSGLGIYFFVAMLIAWVGYFWFQRTRKGFSDVL